MDQLEILGRVASKVATGRSQAYSEAHVLKALQLIDSGEGIGRQRLSNELGIGEGTMRTMIRRLKDEGLAKSSRKGLSLTGPGLEVLSYLSNLLVETELDGTSITIGSQDYAVLVRGASAFIRQGVEQRDAALLSGAKGATTLLFDGERVDMPGTELRLEESVAHLLVERLRPDKGDVIIIGTADDIISAEIGAKSAALKLLRQIIAHPKGT